MHAGVVLPALNSCCSLVRRSYYSRFPAAGDHQRMQSSGSRCRQPKVWFAALGLGGLIVGAIILGIEFGPHKHSATHAFNDQPTQQVKSQGVTSADPFEQISPSVTPSTDLPVSTPIDSVHASPNEHTGVDVPPNNKPVADEADKGLVGTGTLCYPQDGDELTTAVETGTCRYIVLNKPGRTYEYRLKRQIEVRRCVVITSTPLAMSLIDPDQSERIFHVLAGGYLDLRFLRLIQGRGRRVRNAVRNLWLRIGVHARVDLGGELVMSGCSLEQKSPTLERFLEDLRGNVEWQRLSFGGYIFVAGGILRMYGTTVYRFNPYGNPFINDISIGRDILVVAGIAQLVGLNFINIQLWHIKFAVGGIAAVLGGSLETYGLNIFTITGSNNQFGAGLQLFTGGGNLIMIGNTRASFSLLLLRAGFGLFSVSAGNLVSVGYAQTSIAVARADFGTGTFSNAAGTTTLIGNAQYSAHVAAVNMIAGQSFFNGAGTFVLIGGVRSNNGVTTTQMGIGFHIANVAGVSVVRGATSYTSASSRCQIGYGTDTFMGAGFLFFSGVVRLRIILIGLFIGGGNQVWVAAGTGLFLSNRQIAYIRKDWRTTRSTYTVAGTNISRATANTDIFLSKDGLVRLNITREPDDDDNDDRRRLIEEGRNKSHAAVLVRDVHVQEHKLQLPTQNELNQALAQASSDPYSQLRAWFEAVARKSQTADGEGSNKFVITTNNTECVACDVAEGHALGSSPCKPAAICGKGLSHAVVSAYGESAPNPLVVKLGELGDNLFASHIPLSATRHRSLREKGSHSLLAAATRQSRKLRRRLAENVDDDKSPETWWYQGVMQVYCSTDSEEAEPLKNCSDARTVKKALAYWLGDTSGASVGFALAVWDRAVHPTIDHYLGEDLTDLKASMEPATLAECKVGTSYAYSITGQDPAMKARIDQGLKALKQDASGLLRDIEALNEADAEFCALEVQEESEEIIPGLASSIDGLSLLSRNIGPAIIMTADDVYGPVLTARRNRTYEVTIDKFIPGSAVEVRLVDAKDGATVEGQPAFTTSLFPAGGATFEYVVPSQTNLVDGSYFFRASLVDPLTKKASSLFDAETSIFTVRS